MDRRLILSESTTVSARTIMVAEIEALLDAAPQFGVPFDDYQRAIMEENCVSKPTLGSRKDAVNRLRRLYGLDFSDPVYCVFHKLWSRSKETHPLLALQRTWITDQLVRASADYFLTLKPGDEVTPEKTAAWVKARYGNYYSDASVRSIGRSLNSCWYQAGFVEGVSKRARRNAVVMPENVVFAMFLGYLDGKDGAGLFETRMASLLDVSGIQMITLAESAARQGLIKFKHIADVMEIGFEPLTGALP